MTQYVMNSFGRSDSLSPPPRLFLVLSVPSWEGWINPSYSPAPFSC